MVDTSGGGSGSLVISIVFIIISIILLVLFFVVITVKRQIIRMRNRQAMFNIVPVAPGSGAPLAIQQRVRKLIDRNIYVQKTPTVFTSNYSRNYQHLVQESEYAFVFRLKAMYRFQQFVDSLKKLDKKYDKPFAMSISLYFANLRQTLLRGCPNQLIVDFCAVYNHADSDPRPFLQPDLDIFTTLLTNICSECNVSIQQVVDITESTSCQLIRRSSTGSEDSQTALIDLGVTNIGFSQGKEPSIKVLTNDSQL